MAGSTHLEHSSTNHDERRPATKILPRMRMLNINTQAEGEYEHIYIYIKATRPPILKATRRGE